MGVITGTTKLLGVIGHPVEHSLSPVIHNAALARLYGNDSQQELNYVYLAFPVKPGDLRVVVDGFAAIDLRGFNVTLPHKQAILPLLAEVSAIAQVVGAVNTVCRGQGWSGTNTDVEGFLAPLQGQRDWTATTVVILGSGGAARAVVAGCAQLNCAAVQVVGREPQKLQQFRQSWHQADLGETRFRRYGHTWEISVPANLQVHPWEELPDLLPQANLLVNTTRLACSPDIDQSPLSVAAVAQLPQGAIVYDLIYTPRPTRLLQQARTWA